MMGEDGEEDEEEKLEDSGCVMTVDCIRIFCDAWYQCTCEQL